MRTSVANFFFMLGLAVSANAADLKFPELTRPVIDEAGFLPSADVRQIENVLQEMHRQGKAQMAIYVPTSLQGYDIEGFTLAAAEAWKLGQKGTDRGLLLVIAPNERQMRLEVGYGLEGVIPDARARRLLDDILKPALRNGTPGDGVLAVVGQVAQAIDTDLASLSPEERARLQAASAQRAPKQRAGNLLFFPLILLAFGGGIFGILGGLVIGGAVFLFTGSLVFAGIAFTIANFLAMLVRGGGNLGRSRRGLFGGLGGLGGGGFGGFGGGGGGGGFGGGGGSFGGGGSSSRW